MSVTISKPNALGVLHPQTFDQLLQFAKMAASSTMVPIAFREKPADVMLAVQMGSELGLTPMQSIQNIAVINGRPALWGDAIPALCRASSVCDDIVESWEGDGDKLAAVCVAKRKGASPVTSRFSMEDAKKAGLLGKTGPWTQYTRRMLQMRARGFACRDAFPDVLKGLISAEEATDVPDDRAAFLGTTIDSTATIDTGDSATTREAINAAVPLATTPKPGSVRAVIAEITPLLEQAATLNGVAAVEARDDVAHVIAKGSDAQRAALHDLIHAHRVRLGGVAAPDDDLVGDAQEPGPEGAA